MSGKPTVKYYVLQALRQSDISMCLFGVAYRHKKISTFDILAWPSMGHREVTDREIVDTTRLKLVLAPYLASMGHREVTDREIVDTTRLKLVLAPYASPQSPGRLVFPIVMLAVWPFLVLSHILTFFC